MGGSWGILLFSKNEDEAPRSYRSGKNGGVGVPGGSDVGVDAAVGLDMAAGRNGMLPGWYVRGAWACDGTRVG